MSPRALARSSGAMYSILVAANHQVAAPDFGVALHRRFQVGLRSDAVAVDEGRRVLAGRARQLLTQLRAGAQHRRRQGRGSRGRARQRSRDGHGGQRGQRRGLRARRLKACCRSRRRRSLVGCLAARCLPACPHRGSRRALVFCGGRLLVPAGRRGRLRPRVFGMVLFVRRRRGSDRCGAQRERRGRQHTREQRTDQPGLRRSALGGDARLPRNEENRSHRADRSNGERELEQDARTRQETGETHCHRAAATRPRFIKCNYP